MLLGSIRFDGLSLLLASGPLVLRADYWVSWVSCQLLGTFTLSDQISLLQVCCAQFNGLLLAITSRLKVTDKLALRAGSAEPILHRSLRGFP